MLFKLMTQNPARRLTCIKRGIAHLTADYRVMMTRPSAAEQTTVTSGLKERSLVQGLTVRGEMCEALAAGCQNGGRQRGSCRGGCLF
jgi:hypothetical protein